MKFFAKELKKICIIPPLRPLFEWLSEKRKEQKLGVAISDAPRFTKSIIVRPKSVLIVEPHFSHGECLPGHTKYFQDLGYHVDIFTRFENWAENPFALYSEELPRLFASNLKTLKKWLCDSRISEYEYLFFATTVIWDFHPYQHVLEYVGDTPKGKNGCLFIDHAPRRFFDEYNEQALVEQQRLFTLSHLQAIPQLNPHYFGAIAPHKKNAITTFVAIGKIHPGARNYGLLFEAIQKLVSVGITDFSVRVIGKGTLGIPPGIQKSIVHLGRLNYPEMYAEIEKADVIIAALDPFEEDHQHYLQGVTTGNLQLSYGFNRPLVISRLFAEHYELSDDTAIIYGDNDLYDGMVVAIDQSPQAYAEMQRSLQETASEVYRRSLHNLEQSIASHLQTTK